MSNKKYENGQLYTNGVRTIKFRYFDGGSAFFTEDGKREKLSKYTFYNLNLKRA